MKRKNLYLALATLVISAPSWANELDLEFIAEINEPTCNMEITNASGGTLTGDVAGGYTLTIPDIELDKIQNKESGSEATFFLIPKDCQSTTAVSTTISTQESVVAGSNLIVPLDVSDGKTKNIGMGFKRTSTSGDTFVKPNDNTSKITWTAPEFGSSTVQGTGVPMTVALRATTSTLGDLRVGTFSAKATFNFNYE